MGHQYKMLQKLPESMNARNLKVLRSPITNKRVQVYEAIPLVETIITVLVDDDIIWGNTILRYSCPQIWRHLPELPQHLFLGGSQDLFSRIIAEDIEGRVATAS
jgi:hypothetical protein